MGWGSLALNFVIYFGRGAETLAAESCGLTTAGALFFTLLLRGLTYTPVLVFIGCFQLYLDAITMTTLNTRKKTTFGASFFFLKKKCTV